MKDIPFNFSGEGQDFLKEVAEDIVQALGGTLGEENSVTMSLDEDGGTNAVNRNWLFDMLSLNMCLNTDMYINESFRSTKPIRKFGQECGAKHPELLMSALFRKHIAVISQMLNLKEIEFDVLAGFLGHDIRIHREFYRLPEDITQVAKISKLLLEMENGNMSKNKGKSLDEIQFNREEPLEDENSFEEGVDENETATLSVDKTRYNIEHLSSFNRFTFCNDKKQSL